PTISRSSWACESGGLREADLVRLARPIKAAELAAHAPGRALLDQTRDEARGQSVRQPVALARLGVRGMQEAHVFEEPVVHAARVRRPDPGVVESEHHELVYLRLQLELELRRRKTRARAFHDVNEVTYAFDELKP